MTVAVPPYAAHLSAVLAKSNELKLDCLRLVAEEMLVDNKPALVIRRKDSVNGGLLFTSKGWDPYPLDTFKQFVALVNYEFFNGIYHQGCFAAGEYWVPELVPTKYKGDQVKITSNGRSYYWDHEKQVVRNRGM